MLHRGTQHRRRRPGIRGGNDHCAADPQHRKQIEDGQVKLERRHPQQPIPGLDGKALHQIRQGIAGRPMGHGHALRHPG